MKKIHEKLAKVLCIDINKLPGAVILMILTVVVTAFIQSYFTFYMNEVDYNRNVRMVKIKIISDIIEQATYIELLREKVYWHKFYFQLGGLHGLNAKYDEFESKEEAYRIDYERHVSKFKATLVKSRVYFDDKMLAVNVENTLSEGFKYDFDLIESKYKMLQQQNKEKEDVIDELSMIAEEKYNTDFYTLAISYAYTLKHMID